MSDAPNEKLAAPAMVLAEFESARHVLHAATALREAGYTRYDVHSPFPVHGMERAMGLRDSRLGWWVLAFALVGMSGSLVMMQWMGAVDYPLIIGGKPPGALPPMVPIAFELTILFAAFGTIVGMLHLNRLPRHHHPIFESVRFQAASDDKFFVSLSADDPKFDVDAVRALLEARHAIHFEVIEAEVSS